MLVMELSTGQAAFCCCWWAAHSKNARVGGESGGLSGCAAGMVLVRYCCGDVFLAWCPTSEAMRGWSPSVEIPAAEVVLVRPVNGQRAETGWSLGQRGGFLQPVTPASSTADNDWPMAPGNSGFQRRAGGTRRVPGARREKTW